MTTMPMRDYIDDADEAWDEDDEWDDEDEWEEPVEWGEAPKKIKTPSGVPPC